MRFFFITATLSIGKFLLGYQLGLLTAATGNSCYCLNDTLVLESARLLSSRLYQKPEKHSSNYFMNNLER